MSELSKRQNDPGDRVELTAAERGPFFKMLADYKRNWITSADALAVVESIVAARLAALTAERDEQERNAVFEHSNQAYAQGREVTAIQIAAERDAARAELAAANTRCAELDAELRVAEHRLGSIAKDLGMDEPDTPVAPITRHDPRWQELRKHVGVNIMATLDRVTALLPSYEDNPAAEVFMPSEVRQLVQEIRAALTPEGTAQGANHA